ncbi:MAG: endopeptidase La [Fibrobacterales bacterium]|nr:endopeptidase La [Fibrobacterales bacterium]
MSAAPEKESRILPVLPLRGVGIVPGALVPVLLVREVSMKALQAAQSKEFGNVLFAVLQREPDVDAPSVGDLHEIGVEARVVSVMPLSDEMAKVMLEGVSTMRAKRWIAGKSDVALTAEVVPRRMPPVSAKAFAEKRKALLELFSENAAANDIPNEAATTLRAIEEPARFLHAMMSFVQTSPELRQKLLESATADEAALLLTQLLREGISEARLNRHISQNVMQSVSKSQRAFLIREHIRKLGEELEDPSAAASPEIRALRERVLAAPLPEATRKRALEEVRRLTQIPSDSPEYGLSRSWLETVLQLPWGKTSAAVPTVKEAGKALDGGHYGLEKPKRRLKEYVAVLARAPQEQSPVLCLVGPPGVGKTSLAQSMARALGRPFARVALGGVSDEAEIRGHRKTYVGAMPGRIVAALKQAEAMDPVIVLDEIDKMRHDFHGDPAAALLEVLDPEQNSRFRDNYLEVDFDLSKAVFVCTANMAENIPQVLRDRLELISLPGYPVHEKVQIARRHLLPRVRRRNALSEREFDVDEKTVDLLVRNWTMESGVRELERRLDALARRRVVELAEGKKGSGRAKPADLERVLGPAPFKHNRLRPKSRPGMVNGLAYTPVGGEILRVECALVPGKGRLQLTGSLGKVMVESAKIALTLVREQADRLGIERKRFSETDVHVHVPEGAVPKEGPSAGVALFLALASAFTGRPVPGLFAFTGEINLGGDVLPIGGLPEKSLAALDGGATDLWIPAGNEPEAAELPAIVRKGMKIHYVKDIETALGALSPAKKRAR